MILGGTIPADDIPELKELGVAEIFTPAPPRRRSWTSSAGAVTTDCVSRLTVSRTIPGHAIA